MNFTRKQKNCLIALTLCLLLSFTALWSPSSFAWLASSVRSTTFTVESSSVSKFEEAQVWMYSDTEYKDATSGYARSIGWNVVVVDPKKDSTGIEKHFSAIGKFETKEDDGKEITTFDPYFLYFGTINNLVQEQANRPVYLKFKIKLQKNSSNTVKLNYSTPDNYVSVYKASLSGAENNFGYYPSEEVTDNDYALNKELSNTNDYPFLRFRYFYSTTDYTISNLNGTTDTFSPLFNDDSDMGVVEYLKEDDASKLSTTLENEGEEQYYCFYIKISINSETLADALTNSGLKNYMPAYLLFTANLGLEIQTSAIQQ